MPCFSALAEPSEDVVLALVEYLPMYEETRKASSGLKSQSWPARFPSFHSYLSLRASPVSLPQHSSFRQPGDMHDDPRDPHVVRKCQVKHSFGESKRKSTSRYGRGKHSEKHHQQYPLKGVVRCRYGAGMVPVWWDSSCLYGIHFGSSFGESWAPL